ncbi:MAG: amidohydrolase family protein [Gemmatimonadota bacterium]|nr:amidohydrolase family protein [Gemmatimonadota bacterium]
MRRLLTATAALACLALAPQGTRHVRLTLHEGTNIAAAMSPDERTIAFDLLGSIWTMPAAGGSARRITDELMDARQPAWSPDGSRIAFQAYRTNTWNIWTVNADGTGLTQLTAGMFDDREPHWSPDGAKIAFSSDRSGNYDIWTLTLATRELKQVTNSPANDFGPTWGQSGSGIYFASDREQGRGIYTIPAAPETPGAGERLLRAQDGALGPPAFEAAAGTLAFNSISGAHSALFSGTREGAREIGGASEDVFPFRPQFLKNGDVLYTADGKIKRRPSAGGPATIIEFSAEVSFDRPAFTPKRREFNKPGDQKVLGYMHPSLSPDGKQVAFAALGDLWVMPVGGAPRRITNDPFIELNAAWSPDGRWLAYSSDRDGASRVYIRNVATGAERVATTRNAGATSPAFSPEGTRIAYVAEGGIAVSDISRIVGTDVPRDSSVPPVVATKRGGYEPGAPSWSPDGRYVVVGALRPNSTRFREGTNEVLRLAMAPDAEQADTWFDPAPGKSIGMREDFGPVWSPDGTMMAAVVDGRLAVFNVARNGRPTGPLKFLSTDLAASPSWAADSRHLLYQALDRFRIVDVVDASTVDVTPNLTWRAVSPTDQKVVHAGHLWDGQSGAMRDNVDIVVAGNRIRSVEPHRAALHTGTVIDASNEYVVPGLIEIHSHLSKTYGEALGRIWLSWGITTVRNPATSAFEAAEEKEAVESGRRIGPRSFSAGEPFDGTRIYYPGGTSLDGGVQLTQQLERTAALGFDFVKTYVRLPDMLQKRVVEESHRRGLPVTSHELYPAMAYGADGVEHFRGTSRRGYSPKQSQLNRIYDDVIQLLAASGMTVTPTIGIYGGFQLQMARDASVLDDPRFALYPPGTADRYRGGGGRGGAQSLAEREALVSPQEKAVARVVRAGGHVVAGTDAPINPYGIALLMELEQYVSGGLTPLEALRTATVENARAIGMPADLGAVAPGYFADFTTLGANPLANIRALRDVRQVMKDGALHTREDLLRGPARR